MSVTKTDNQEDRLKKNIGELFLKSQPFMESGLCPTKDLLSTTLDKWSLLVIFHLGYYKCLRFGELKKKVSGISARMLTVTLKKLEEMESIHREVYAEVPLRVEYSLTPFGEELSARLAELGIWFIDTNKKLLEKKATWKDK